MLQLDADLAFEISLLASGVEPQHAHRPGITQPQTFQDFHRRRLARAVGTQHAEDLTNLDRKRDAVHGLDVAVRLAQVLDFDDGHAGSQEYGCSDRARVTNLTSGRVAGLGQSPEDHRPLRIHGCAPAGSNPGGRIGLGDHGRPVEFEAVSKIMA